jgi:hypothetical protein
MGPRARLDALEREKFIVPAGNRTPVVQPVAHRYTDRPTYIYIYIIYIKSKVCLYICLLLGSGVFSWVSFFGSVAGHRPNNDVMRFFVGSVASSRCDMYS